MVSLPYPSSATDQDQQAVDWLTHFFASALADGASDIHLEPFENVLRVRVRIDGHLQERFYISCSSQIGDMNAGSIV